MPLMRLAKVWQLMVLNSPWRELLISENDRKLTLKWSRDLLGAVWEDVWVLLEIHQKLPVLFLRVGHLASADWPRHGPRDGAESHWCGRPLEAPSCHDGPVARHWEGPPQSWTSGLCLRLWGARLWLTAAAAHEDGVGQEGGEARAGGHLPSLLPLLRDGLQGEAVQVQTWRVWLVTRRRRHALILPNTRKPPVFLNGINEGLFSRCC